MAIQKGRAIFIQLSEDVVLGATNHTLDISPEYEEYETKDVPGKQRSFKGFTGTASVEGLVVTTPDASGLGTDEVLMMATTGTPVELSVCGIPNLQDDQMTVRTAAAWITAFSVGAPVDGNATYNATFTFNELK
jgi:hypothetical protein